MPTNLHDRATDQLALHVLVAAQLRQRLLDARNELDREHDDPATVAVDDWQTQFGAAQHLSVARTELSANAEELARTRGELAGVATPAEAGAQGSVLRGVMVEGARLVVELRHAEERVATAQHLIEQLQALATRADREVAAAEQRETWGEQHQASGDRLRASLATGPLATIVDDADGVRGGATFTAASDRIADLLPAALRARADARHGEAHEVAARAAAHLAAATLVTNGRIAAAHPLDGAVAAAEARLLDAEAALEGYVARATGRLGAATTTLEAVADLDDLDPSQAAALDPAGHADAISALGHESGLAAAWAAVADAERAVDQAILEALDADPDADPEADAAVIAARDHLTSAAVQDPLDDARAAYEPLAPALDEWEVEVPPTLWTAVIDIAAATRTLDELADEAARDAFVTELDDASDMVATALDERDVAVRGDLLTEAERVRRAATSRALRAGTAARLGAYTRGDGPAGRSGSER